MANTHALSDGAFWIVFSSDKIQNRTDTVAKNENIYFRFGPISNIQGQNTFTIVARQRERARVFMYNLRSNALLIS